MTEIIWNENLDIEHLKRRKKSIRSYRKHDGYKAFQAWAYFLQDMGMEISEIHEHLVEVHKLCTPLIYGSEWGIMTPNKDNARYYQMDAAMADLYD